MASLYQFTGPGVSAGAAMNMYNEALRKEALEKEQLEQTQAQTLQMKRATGSGMVSTSGQNATNTGSIGAPTYPSSTIAPPNLTGTVVPNISAPSVNIPAITGGSGTNALSADVQAQYDPWSRYRDDAGNLLNTEMNGTNPSDFYMNKLEEMSSGTFSPDDPSYQWRYQQGQKAAERSLASRGLLNSGNALLELQQYGQGAASQEYGAQFDRMLKGLAGTESAYDSSMKRLMEMAGVGLDPTAGG